MSKLMQSFPYPTPRAEQREVLEFLEKNWDRYDVFVIVVPTGGGKTALSKALLTWKHSASYIAPTNLLVDQFLEEFPETPRLHRLDAYWCEEWLQSCAQTRARKKGFCRGCVCSGDLATAKYRRGPGVYNYYTYLSHRIHRPLLVVDEAHGLISTIQDRVSELVWHHDYQYPDNGDHATLRRWLEKLPTRIRKHKKIQHLEEALTAESPRHVIGFTTEQFNGKGTRRGQPEERRCLKLYPVDVRDHAGMFWPTGVEKVVLMSATIGPKDIEELGLASKRVVYLESGSPIPAERRPIQLVPVVNMTHSGVDTELPRLAEEIDNIAAYHTGEKGIVHVTYSLAERLRPLLTGNRYIFHDRLDKAEKYEKYRQSPAVDGRVLIACGMYEGIDLPEDLGRWQVVAKTPFPSLADPAIAHKAEKDPDWYHWTTLKALIQAAGRVCRTPTDYGITYFLDKQTERLLSNCDHLLPHWFNDALAAGRDP